MSEEELFSFGDAIERLKEGEVVSRTGWNGRGMWLSLQRPGAGSKMTLPYIYMCTARGDLVPWLASQTDMLAEDWHIPFPVDRMAPVAAVDESEAAAIAAAGPGHALVSPEKQALSGLDHLEGEAVAVVHERPVEAQAAATEAAPRQEQDPESAVRGAYHSFTRVLHHLGGTNPGQSGDQVRFGNRLLATAHTHAETARLYAEEHLRRSA